MKTTKRKKPRLPSNERSFTPGKQLMTEAPSLDDYDGNEGQKDREHSDTLSDMAEQYGQESARKPESLTKIFPRR